MIKRYEDALMNALEHLDHVGWVEIEWWKIRQWYGADRITKKVYRDLRDRFSEIDDGDELHMYDSTGPSLLLVKGNNLQSFSVKLGEEDE